jgi:hypothetical protein
VFAVVGTLVIGVLFVIGPSFELGRADLRRCLSADAAGTDVGRAIRHGRTLLVGTQMALAVLGVASVVAIIRADRRFGNPAPGYDVHDMLSASLMVHDSTARTSLERPLLEFVRARPGVVAASIARAPEAIDGLVSLWTDGSPSRRGSSHWIDASPDLFATLGIRASSGRLPTEAEVSARTPTVVLSEDFAKWLFGDGSALGRRVTMRPPDRPPIKLTVIGVVPEIRRGPDFATTDGLMYTSLSLPLDSSQTRLFVRVSGEPAHAIEALRRGLATWDRRVVVADLRTKQSEVDASQSDRHGRQLFLNAIAAMSLLLAGIGIYGVTGYITESREKEIAVRRALGAGYAHVLRVSLGNLALVAAVGAFLGGLAATPFAHILDSLVRDPLRDFFPIVVFPVVPTMVGAATLFVVAIGAAYVPVRRLLGRDIATAIR